MEWSALQNDVKVMIRLAYHVHRLMASSLLLSLEVVQQHASLLALLTPVSNDHTRAVDNLSGIALSVQHAEASPLAEHLSVRNLDQRDLVL